MDDTRPLRFYRTFQHMRASSAGFGPERHFAPVIIAGDCRGHLLRTARGFRLFDRVDKELGTFKIHSRVVGRSLRHHGGGTKGPSNMGSEDEVEQSRARPCRE
jgi:hypothetical protein